MDLFRARAPDHLDDLAHGSAAHDGIVDDDDPLAIQNAGNGIVFYARAEIPDALGGLDEGAAYVMVADEPPFHGDPAGLAVADRGDNAGVGNGDHQVGVNRTFLGENPADVLTNGVDTHTVNRTVRSGEVDVFKDALCIPLFLSVTDAADVALAIDNHHFARFDSPHGRGPDNIQSAGFGSEDRRIIESAHGQRPDTERVPDTDHAILIHNDHGKRATHSPDGGLYGIDEVSGLVVSQKMDQDFAVGRGVEDGALGFQLRAHV